jgi:DNA polymerase
VNVEARRSGTIIHAHTFEKDHVGARHKFAQKVGVQDEVVTAAIQKAFQTDDASKEESGAATTFGVSLRGLHEPKAGCREFAADAPLEAIQAALDYKAHPSPEPVLEWSDGHGLALLDIDFHDQLLEQRPGPHQLTVLATLIRPQPALWWCSHGRGLHLIYTAQAGFNANELAACAILTARSLEPLATEEILTRTRHPAYPRPGFLSAGPITTGLASADIGVLGKVLGREVDPDAIQTWLSEKGLEINHKYEHGHCPVDPQATSHGEPVLVGEAGITCFKCEANGLTLGSKKPGFFPYVALVAGGISNRLANAARNFCHWEHARFLLEEDLGLSGEIARLCYCALLKAIHGPEDERIDEVFHRGRGLVRMDGYWVTDDLSRAHCREGLTERLKKLPALQHVHERNGDTGVTVDEEKLGIFRGVDDLTTYGYPRVQPVRGMRIACHWRPGADPRIVQAVVLPEFLRPEPMRPYRPQYVPETKRMPITEAERIISESFPGINFRYLRLLIAARGCAEGGTGEPPKIATDGPSGSGKSTTVAIAAALIGDQHCDVPWSENVEHFMQGLYEAALNAGLVTSDEIIKMATSKRGNVLAGLNALLTFKPGSTIRKLYTGPVTVRQVPALIITDVSFPRELLCDEQLGRRHVYVHLDRKVDWLRSAKDIRNWRTQSRDHAAAANAFVSDVIDTYFADESLPVFEDVARDLGFSLLSQGGNLGLDPKADLVALFEACCSPTAAPAPDSTWKGRGWKLIKRDAVDALSQRWLAVCDNPGDGFVTSRRAKEADWSQVLGTADAVECDVSENGKSALAIRFRSGASRSKSLKVNEELIRRPPLAPPDELPPPNDIPPPPEPDVPPTPGPASNASGLRDHHPANAATNDAAATRPTPVVFVDLETRSACDLKKEGGRRYANHPSTQIMTVVALIDNHVVGWVPLLNGPLKDADVWPEGYSCARLPVTLYYGPTLPAPLAEAIAAGQPFCAHNAYDFDMHVWRARGLPEPTTWLDTLPHARAAGLPGKLDELGTRLLGKGKDKEGTALVQQLCRPNAQGMFAPLTSQQATRLLRYNIADVLLLARVYDVASGHGENEVIALDRVINERGIAFDDQLARALVSLESCVTDDIKADVERLTGGAIKAGDLRRDTHIQTWLRERGVSLPDMQRTTLERYLSDVSQSDAAVRCVLEARLTVNRITASKLENALACQDADGRLHDLLVYHQAHTGRWSSRRVQLHNLPRPHDDLKDPLALIKAVDDPEQFRRELPQSISLADGLAALLRMTLRAESDKTLLIADYAGIEARGVAWCADERRQLELFAQGGDNYCDFGRQIFGYPITKQNKRERGVGKEAVLGCGYGMGDVKFAARCAAKNVDLAAAGTSARAVVEVYRDAYPAIAGSKTGFGEKSWRQGGLWKDVEAAAFDAVQSKRLSEAGRCRFYCDGSSLVIQLPSGRRIFYRNARIEDRVPSYCSTLDLPEKAKPTLVYDDPKKGETTTYGGKLSENIVQALCRDLLVAALVECEKQNLPVVLHVHDEIVCEVPMTGMEEYLRRLVTIMSVPPVWASGFPIEVEGFAAERYVKSAPQGAPVIKARNGRCL